MSNLAVTGSCRPGAEDLSSDLPALKPPSQVQITLGNFDRTTASFDAGRRHDLEPATGMTTPIKRLPCPLDFPDVVVHRELKARNSHPAYSAAKGGDAMTAHSLVADVLNEESYQRIAALIGSRKPLVAALESGGFNAIPDAMAQAIAQTLSLTMAGYDFANRTTSDTLEPMAGFD